MGRMHMDRHPDLPPAPPCGSGCVLRLPVVSHCMLIPPRPPCGSGAGFHVVFLMFSYGVHLAFLMVVSYVFHHDSPKLFSCVTLWSSLWSCYDFLLFFWCVGHVSLWFPMVLQWFSVFFLWYSSCFAQTLMCFLMCFMCFSDCSLMFSCVWWWSCQGFLE